MVYMDEKHSSEDRPFTIMERLEKLRKCVDYLGEKTVGMESRLEPIMSAERPRDEASEVGSAKDTGGVSHLEMTLIVLEGQFIEIGNRIDRLMARVNL